MTTNTNTMYASTDALAQERAWGACTRIGDSIEQLKRSRDQYAHTGDTAMVEACNDGIDAALAQLRTAVRVYDTTCGR